MSGLCIFALVVVYIIFFITSMVSLERLVIERYLTWTEVFLLSIIWVIPLGMQLNKGFGKLYRKLFK